MRKKSDKFKWMLGQPAPLLKSHSFAKLNIVEDYLSKYFETVAPNPGQDKITISLVDGFCGGGLYTYNGNSQYGSPILRNKPSKAYKKTYLMLCLHVLLMMRA